MKKEEKEKEVKEIASPANTGARDGGGDVNTGTEGGMDTGVTDDGNDDNNQSTDGRPNVSIGNTGPILNNPEDPKEDDNN